MTRRGFTMVELLLAVILVGLVTTFAFLTFRAVSHGWQTSTDYMDKLQRTDYALNQVISGLRSMYYPHDGSQNDQYGFTLANNGDGERPRTSDVITWSKRGSAIVGSRNSIGSTVHRVQLMVLEEGDDTYREPIEVTGLYARLMRDAALIPKNEDGDETDYGFGNEELYQPLLIADGIVGFDCQVIAKQEDAGGGIRNESTTDKKDFEEEFSESNSVPYKVRLTFHMADRDGRSYRQNTSPIVRIIRIPVHEQSLDGAAEPGDEDSKSSGGSKKGGSK